jgi:hypothetical protein
MIQLRVNTEVLAPSLEEAEWLRDLLQNPVYEDETRSEKRMREIWHPALDVYIKTLKAPMHPQCGTCFRDKPDHDYDDDIPF